MANYMALTKSKRVDRIVALAQHEIDRLMRRKRRVRRTLLTLLYIRDNAVKLQGKRL